ncbi:glycoside hydrolase family 76 protein [Trichoderma cornu-damae]|uniref:Glycoside hydrolase family 76 protein n=1 Tax=Trichoderma cornu-damae TaxID=654480 RepID=A0A9P8QMA9_9HYPO|nr:glycoside hydrolase family 76 protein [Trichoderma cornu-damae]
MASLIVAHTVVAFAFLPAAIGVPVSPKQEYCSVVAADLADCRPPPDNFLPFTAETSASRGADTGILKEAFSALAVLQNEYYQIGRNTWPSAIDWTAAVIETVVAGMLSTLTKSLDFVDPGTAPGARETHENLISSVYDQVIGYHFGQDIVAIPNQAYDDMLWVVLGWIEASNFARSHDSLYFPNADRSLNNSLPTDMDAALATLPWRGQLWIPLFRNRAKNFWLLGARGWDTTLCHGGMIWNPRLEPYKNAITNELYISASISMYRYLGNGSPVDRDPTHLQAATEGYRWLANSNMTNSAGLFVDGFHIDKGKPGNVECDVRDEMVYTYNQGVLLTGQRGLWDVTGSPSYLADGHDLVQAVIKATGWDLEANQPMDSAGASAKLPQWRGLGRGGILEDQCDASSTCSQDSQTFKGIYFHHLTAFCRPLEWEGGDGRARVNADAFGRVKAAHGSACRAYLGWVEHNALAALGTRDDRGRFGMWWGAGLFGDADDSRDGGDGIDHDAANTTDYRNRGTPEDDVWGRGASWQPGPQQARPDQNHQQRLETPAMAKPRGKSDPNDGGRGRTVETQVGGVAVLRAYWEMSRPLASA